MTAVQARQPQVGPGADPVRVPANQFPHFYAGGERISRFRGAPGATGSGTAGAGGQDRRPDNRPEDWVASTTTRFGQPEVGLSLLPDGRLLREVIAADPLTWLGPAHLAAFGAELNLLVKLLDAGQRLIVHAHPDLAFAGQHLALGHGKTEAWVILETDHADAEVYLGFRERVPAATLAGWVRDQDTENMLAALNVVSVAPGDAVLVPAGLPHAIGAGALICELQEPTDLSVVLEWRGFDLDGPTDGHLGLGYDVALQCVDRSGWGVDRVAALRGPGPSAHSGGSAARSLLPAAADPFFRLDRLTDGAELAAGVGVLVVAAGAGTLERPGAAALPLNHADTVLVPYAAGPGRIRGPVEVLLCRPPAPPAG